MAKKKGRLIDLIPPCLPANAVAREAQPGYKAGNPLIDRVNENSRETLFRKFMDFYNKIIKKK
ncbi:MAG: hypothetical protein V1886_00980 [archaeon]